MANVIESMFRPIYGLPCWNVQSGYGSFLTLEFGDPSLVIDEPQTTRLFRSLRVRRQFARRHVSVRGAWHLWIYCCEWRVTTNGKLIGDSDPEGSTKRRIKRGAAELDGQKLLQVSVNPADQSTVFEFDLGSRLATKPYNSDSEQWYFSEPNGMVLTYRADGKYSHSPDATPPDKTEWLAL